MQLTYRHIIAAALIASLAAAPAFSQGLPGAAAKAGFSKAAGKMIGAFQSVSLSGARLDGAALKSAPALYHVWSIAKDPSGEGPATVASLRLAMPDAAVFAASADKPELILATVERSGLDRAHALGAAQELIRALGGPSAPAWIFVAPGGEIVAYRLGRLESGKALEAAKALFAAYAPPAAASPAAEAAPSRSGSSPAVVDVALNEGLVDASFVGSMELEIVAELNLARTEPKRYADLLRAYRALIRGNYLERPGETTVVLAEGRKAVDEAIAFLERQKPLPPLALSRGLSRAAADHAADQGKTGQTGHSGSDRSTMGQRIERYGSWKKTAGENIAYGSETARDVVIQLIVDDGVASRGHRANIFNPAFLVVGVAFGKHPGYRTVCVQDFAGGYEER